MGKSKQYLTQIALNRLKGLQVAKCEQIKRETENKFEKHCFNSLPHNTDF